MTHMAGAGTDRRLAMLVKRLIRASRQGNASALECVALTRAVTHGAPPERKKALARFRQAAKSGIEHAIVCLAELSKAGMADAKDRMWIHVAEAIRK